jgi:hypothetical protein
VGTLDIAGGLCYPIHRTGTRSANDSTRFQGLAAHSEVVFYVRTFWSKYSVYSYRCQYYLVYVRKEIKKERVSPL